MSTYNYREIHPTPLEGRCSLVARIKYAGSGNPAKIHYCGHVISVTVNNIGESYVTLSSRESDHIYPSEKIFPAKDVRLILPEELNLLIK